MNQFELDIADLQNRMARIEKLQEEAERKLAALFSDEILLGDLVEVIGDNDHPASMQLRGETGYVVAFDCDDTICRIQMDAERGHWFPTSELVKVR